ncbi:metallophosphoesterase family protein [Saccharicrinis aurantiacus]|uniref:metallophosphoesterase family protein n=1 Tax=Saccharicrinis aurantiacus TaxID=1849719 RepID=UPI00248FCCAB|nr:metallophosphoesterase family protein [Saccharicrinis aurantiacus]
MKALKIFFSLLVIIFSSCQHSAEQDQSLKPDRIILSIQEDPTTQMGITWRTMQETPKSLVQVSIENSTPDLKETAKTYTAQTYSYNNGKQDVISHRVTIKDLEPATVYAYRVGDGSNWSEWNTFETADKNESKLSFVYFGDVQYGFNTVWGRVLRQSLKACPNPAFFMYAGDLITTAGDDLEWEQFFEAGDWVFRTFPILATPGNHEHFKNNGAYGDLAPHWHANFCFTENGPKGLENTVYYTDQNDVRIISLNTTNLLTPGVDIDEQLNWFKSVLENNPQRWTVVTMHHPIHNLKGGRNDKTISEILQPIFEDYGVDLILQGHDHAYGRLVDTHKKSDKYVGPAYVVSAAGAKMYSFNFEDWADRLATNTQLYQVIDIDGDELVFSAYLVDGEMFDQFKLTKQTEGENIYTTNYPRQAEDRMELGKRARKGMSEEDIEAYQTKVEAFFESNRK